MHEQVLGGIGPVCDTEQGAREAAYDEQREHFAAASLVHQDYLLREQAAREAAYAAQMSHTRREKALEAALRTTVAKHGHEPVLEAARAYEAYLKGE